MSHHVVVTPPPPPPPLVTGVYLVKQVLRSKHRIRLLDYELNSLHKLKLRLAKEWKDITEKAEDDIRYVPQSDNRAVSHCGGRNLTCMCVYLNKQEFSIIVDAVKAEIFEFL